MIGGWVQSWRRFDLPLTLFVVSVFAAPFYVLPSGLPQPGDLVMVLAVIAFVIAGRLRLEFPVEARGYVAFIVAFCAYVGFVSVAWTGISGDLVMLRPLAFYTFNVATGLVVLSMLPRYGPWICVLLATLPALALAEVLFVGVLGFRTPSLRQTFMFNNPNQLGYFAVIAVSQFFAAPRRVQRPLLLEVGVLLIAILLTLASASRAALVAMVPLGVLVLTRNRRAGWIVAAVALVISSGILVAAPAVLEPIAARLEISDVGRGYDRILHHPGYLLFGAGEGAVYRFETALDDHELHSSLGTVFFSYGLVGLVLFLAAILQPVAIGGWRMAVPLAPPLVYGLTHQGLRFTDMWILISALMLRAIVDKRDAAAATTPAAP